MGKRQQRRPGPHAHAEGQHGARTHARFVEQLQASATPDDEAASRPVEGHQRLHQDRRQHDEAEKSSETVEAMREIRRGPVDENVIMHARVPHEGDTQ